MITDGQVNNTSEVLKLVEQNSTNARVFAFGVGDQVQCCGDGGGGCSDGGDDGDGVMKW